MRSNILGAASLLTAAGLLLAGCTAGTSGPSSASSSGSSPQVTLTYSLWDPNQLPSYQKCADGFTAKTGINVKITQLGWGDYWSGITTGLVSGTAPDVITDHVAYYPELAASAQLLDLAPYVKKDNFDTAQYTGNLADLWVMDGKRYGLPQDWDTIALVYNTSDAQAAGYDAARLNNLTWNPKDGGTFGKAIAHLTIDANRVRGDEPGFDKNKVSVYGWALEQGGGVVGQTQWSWTALSTGFQYLDKNPFGTEYKLADPRLEATLTWWQQQIAAGYVVPFAQAGQLGLEPQLLQHKASMVSDGSWRINTWAGSKEPTFAFAKLPVGPQGRKTIINGLAPSITAGTKHPDEAWQLVKYIASADCQDVVAANAVVFPAIPKAAEAAAQAHKAAGVDVSAFLDEAKDSSGLVYYPITLKANEINTDAQAVIDNIQQLKTTPKEALPALATTINQLLH